jgi:hypothetical protein
MISYLKYLLSALFIVATLHIYSQVELKDIFLDNTITKVQPMTGIVFWDNSGDKNTDVISLEFSYMLYNKVVKDSGIYNWDIVENKLNAIAGRKHQVIFRFRYVYPGYETSVPEYILNREDYNETVGESEGKVTHFPDWTNEELKRFTLEFYTKFAERYDDDPRLAFIQVGFGLWAEYHIYDGPFILGKTFPSKEFQEEFFHHLDASFNNIPWSISIDAADDTYTPFAAKPELKNIKFGLFDDSFMHKNHSGYNTSCWNFFDRTRYKTSPAGGEFSYYSSYDQTHVLDFPDGPYGKPYETFANDFHITYMIGNDQPDYQTMERIKEASMASGYKFKIVRLQTASDTSVFEIMNYGVAPIYYDAYISVNGIRSPESLKLLAPGETKTYSVSAGAENAEITIECDKLVEGQEIQFYGTQELPVSLKDNFKQNSAGLLYPNPAIRGDIVYVTGNKKGELIKYSVYDGLGKLEMSNRSNLEAFIIDTGNLKKGLYFLKIENKDKIKTTKFLVL